MAGKSDTTPGTLPLGKGQGLLMSPTQGQAILLGGISVPAISKHLKAFLYGWLPLSDAYRHPFLQTAFYLLPLASFHYYWTFPISGLDATAFGNRGERKKPFHWGGGQAPAFGAIPLWKGFNLFMEHFSVVPSALCFA